MGNWFLAAGMGCSLIALSPKFAVAQNGSVERDERIGRYLEAFSTELGLSVDQVILGENIQSKKYSGWGDEISDEKWGFKSSQPGDFGFVARNKDSGDIVAVFNHDAPTYNANGSLEIAGYDQGENVVITTVSGEAWDEAQKKSWRVLRTSLGRLVTGEQSTT